VNNIFLGTAGWTIPRAIADRFPSEGSGLERYAAQFSVVEINSSFHRPHRAATWQRWRDSVPATFRFSVKMPKRITHERRLTDCSEELSIFMTQAALLGGKLGVLLVQLPPKLAFEAELAANFFAELSSRCDAQIVCEPRHPSWFMSDAGKLLEECRVARVAADPAICPQAAVPGGWGEIAYWRLHGSPRIYRSSYQDRIAAYAEQLTAERQTAREVWCILDNTASGAGAADALSLAAAVSGT
jgi:uncharacterized protein YecE (DUF72 family)